MAEKQKSGNLYVPFQQMNTGTFCTLYASIVNGNRGKQERVNSCPGYCRDHAFLYPQHLDMLGRFNSVFYADLKLLENGQYIREALNRGRRVIFNFDLPGIG